MTDMIIKLPFPGFYESVLSGEIDNLEEQEAEYFESDRQAEDGVPKELRVSGSDYAEMLTLHCTDYSACHEAIARAYVDAFCIQADEALGLPLALTFESMTSPRFYNFETDRLFAHIASDTVRTLYARSEAEGHATLSRVIAERFTSYDGFASHYSNSLDTWDADPTEWDHNELETLLIACLRMAGVDPCGDEFRWAIYEGLMDGDGLYSEWSAAVDWAKLDGLIAEKREELAEELRANDPDWVPPAYRCPDTPDMFAGR